MATVYLTQGPSGCGKTTFAKKLSESNGALICSADSFFMRNGEYKWNREHIGTAHKWCYNRAYEELMAGKNVIIDNTNTTWKEIEKYAELACKYKALFHIYRPVTIDANLFIGRNVHGVPESSVQAMVDRFINAEELKDKLQEHFPELVWGVSYFENI